MPWVVRDAVRDINRTVGRRWQAIDPLLPDPATLPAGCGEPLVVTGDNGRMAGLGVCVHQHIPPDSLNQTWGAADRFTLVPRLAGQDVGAPADQLLAQWRDHLAGIGATRGPGHVGQRRLAEPGRHRGPRPAQARAAAADGDRRQDPAEHRRSAPRGPPRGAHGVTIRAAGPADEEQVARPGAAAHPVRHAVRRAGMAGQHRPAGPRGDPRSLARPATWTWLAERNGRAVGLLVAQPPQEAGWIAGMTSAAPAAYLQTMFVDQAERGTGIGAALVRHLHARLDGAGVGVTLLHHSQVNPLSAPFWYRMGYRPLWTSWEARPASALR